MKKIYVHKTADSHDYFSTYTVHGYTLAESREEAAEYFGVKNPNGYDVVDELDREEWKREVAKNIDRVEELARLRSVIDRLNRVIEDTVSIQRTLRGITDLCNDHSNST